MNDSNTNKSKKNKRRVNQKDSSPETSAFETFALAGGKKNPRSGTTIPTEDGVDAAKAFVEENKK